MTTSITATFISHKRGQRRVHPNRSLVRVEGVSNRITALQMIGNAIISEYTKKGINYINKGVITKAHGNAGVLQAKFLRNLPPQMFGKNLTVKLFKLVATEKYLTTRNKLLDLTDDVNTATKFLLKRKHSGYLIISQNGLVWRNIGGSSYAVIMLQNSLQDNLEIFNFQSMKGGYKIKQNGLILVYDNLKKGFRLKDRPFNDDLFVFHIFLDNKEPFRDNYNEHTSEHPGAVKIFDKFTMVRSTESSY